MVSNENGQFLNRQIIKKLKYKLLVEKNEQDQNLLFLDQCICAFIKIGIKFDSISNLFLWGVQKCQYYQLCAFVRKTNNTYVTWNKPAISPPTEVHDLWAW